MTNTTIGRTEKEQDCRNAKTHLTLAQVLVGMVAWLVDLCVAWLVGAWKHP
jgi:hypothetical protein